MGRVRWNTFIAEKICTMREETWSQDWTSSLPRVTDRGSLAAAWFKSVNHLCCGGWLGTCMALACKAGPNPQVLLSVAASGVILSLENMTLHLLQKNITYIYLYLFIYLVCHHDLFCLEPGSVNLGLASSHGRCHLWPKMCSPQTRYNEILSALTRFVFSQVNYHVTLKTKTYSEFWSQAFYILLDSTSPPMSRRLCRPNGLQVRLMTVDKNLSWF